MFVNKYKDTVFDLSDVDNNTFCSGKNEIGWVLGSYGGWNIFRVCYVEGVENEKLAFFLAILIICLKHQRKRIMMEMPESGSKEEKVCDSNDHIPD